jgi:hypothetical protein
MRVLSMGRRVLSAGERSWLAVSILTMVLAGSLNISQTTAQKHEVDAVYLQNGEVFRGKIVPDLNGDIVRLETLCFNTRLFNNNEILRIEKEKIKLQSYPFSRISSVRGYFNRTDMGFLIGSGNNQNNVIFSLQMVNGYKLGKRYYPGIGTGVEFYEHAVVPLYADFSYMLMDSRVSPFVRGSVGYSFSIEDPPEVWGARTDNRGGMLYAAALGTSVRTGSSSALTISIVYRFQSLKSVYEEEWNNDVLNLEKQYNRLAIRIGFMFD